MQDIWFNDDSTRLVYHRDTRDNTWYFGERNGFGVHYNNLDHGDGVCRFGITSGNGDYTLYRPETEGYYTISAYYGGEFNNKRWNSVSIRGYDLVSSHFDVLIRDNGQICFYVWSYQHHEYICINETLTEVEIKADGNKTAYNI